MLRSNIFYYFGPHLPSLLSCTGIIKSIILPRPPTWSWHLKLNWRILQVLGFRAGASYLVSPRHSTTSRHQGWGCNLVKYFPASEERGETDNSNKCGGMISSHISPASLHQSPQWMCFNFRLPLRLQFFLSASLLKTCKSFLPDLDCFKFVTLDLMKCWQLDSASGNPGKTLSCRPLNALTASSTY